MPTKKKNPSKQKTKMKSQNRRGYKTPINDKDQISNLPEHLRHHILTFLPTIEAATISVLSSVWKDLWLILPCFRFDQNFFDKIIQNHPKITDEQLLNTIDEIFTRRSKFALDHKYNVMLEELIFHSPRSAFVNHHSLYKRIETRAVKEFGVKKLEFTIDANVSFTVARFSQNSSNNTGMTHLTLKEMWMVSCTEAFVGLQVMSLNRIKIGQLVLDRLISNFYQLKSVELIHCIGDFDTLNASCLKQLVNLCVKLSKDSSTTFKKIVINAPNLERFIFHDESSQDKLNCVEIDDLALSKGLKSFDIKGVNIADEWLSHIVAQLTRSLCKIVMV